MASIVPISDEWVSQTALKELIFVKNERKRLRKLEKGLARTIVERICHGGDVEPGTHVATVKIKQKGLKLKVKLAVR